MREKMYSPDIAVLATSDDNVVGNRHETVHCVRVTRELVTVQPILAPAQYVLRIQRKQQKSKKIAKAS